MNREGVTYEAFLDACYELEGKGINPTPTKIRDLLGQGSFTTLSKYFKEWRHNLAPHYVEVERPSAVAAAIEDVWQKLTAEADAKIDSIKEEANKTVHAANARVLAAEESAARLTAQNETMQEKLHATSGHAEILSLDLKQERMAAEALQASFAALKEKFDLLQHESIAHISTLKSLQEREIKSYTERLAELSAAHKSEMDRLLTRVEADRHRAIAELDRAQVELQKRDKAMRELELGLQQSLLENKHTLDLWESASRERDQLHQQLQKLEIIWDLQEKHFIFLQKSMNHSGSDIKCLQEAVSGIGSDVGKITKMIKRLEDEKAKKTFDTAEH